MDRERVLRRIVGPQPFGNTTMSWVFTARRQLRHGKPGHGSDQGRRFELKFNPRTRQFTVEATRRLSKKRKRVSVTVSKGMVAYLRSRLHPKHIALCMAASIGTKQQTDPKQDPVGWVNQQMGAPFLPQNRPALTPLQSRILRHVAKVSP